MNTSILREKPAVQRFAATKSAEPVKVVRDGGRYGAGVIEGVSLCSRGEALGHYLWCDSEFLDQIVAAGNSNPKLLKSRLTHPNLCSDGVDKALGTIETIERVGDQVIGNQHIYDAARITPDGDLASYVMKRAEEDPKNFGLSIVFEHDLEAEEEHLLEHGAKRAFTEEGWSYWDMTDFKSPDSLNVNGLPHARVAALWACDVVDDPAANPNGLFHRPNEMLSQATSVLDFVIGKSRNAPALSAFGAEISPDRVREFFNNYLAANGLSLTKKEPPMPPANTQLDDAPVDDPKKKKPEDEPATEASEGGAPADDAPEDDDDDQPAEGGTEDDPEKKKKTEQAATGDLAKFCAAFGHEDGAKYLLAGDSFQDAQTKHIAALTERLGKAEETLKAFATSGVDPVPFTAAKDKGRDGTSEAASHDSSEANRAKFAAANATSRN